MTTTDIQTEIDALLVAKRKAEDQLIEIMGALQAFQYMLAHLDTPPEVPHD